MVGITPVMYTDHDMQEKNSHTPLLVFNPVCHCHFRGTHPFLAALLLVANASLDQNAKVF